MPRRLRTISGDKLVAHLEKLGFTLVYGKGSHVKLVRFVEDEQQVIAFARHKTIAKGTLKAVYLIALQYVPESELRGIFYTD